MKVTKFWVEKNFNTFNEKYFDGKLPTPHFLINNSYRALGLCGYDRKKTNPHYIKISNFYDRQEKEIQQTLLHEMIHLYFYSKGMLKEGHGRNFQNMARSFDKYGWDIHTKSTSNHVSEKNVIPMRYLVKFNHVESGKIWLCCISENKLETFNNWLKGNPNRYMDIEWFVTTSERFGNYTRCQKKLSGHTFADIEAFKKEVIPYVAAYSF